jgi:hypothetical protein
MEDAMNHPHLSLAYRVAELRRHDLLAAAEHDRRISLARGASSGGSLPRALRPWTAVVAFFGLAIRARCAG